MTGDPGVDVRFERFSAHEALRLRDVVRDVYLASYGDAIASGNVFNDVSAFMRRFDSYASNHTIDLIVAYVGDDAVGQTWGWPLMQGTTWWTGLVSEPEPGFAVEDGRRTFALSEIMVVEGHTGRGVARALHDELLTKRHERRAVLLVRPSNKRAYARYLRWGWRTAAQLTPKWDGAPTFDVLVRRLPLA